MSVSLRVHVTASNMIIDLQHTDVRHIELSYEKPNKSKAKGRTIPDSEPRSTTLGAKGPKLGTKACRMCGLSSHDVRTCPDLPHNKVRIEEKCDDPAQL
jgi:hypothetical protein